MPQYHFNANNQLIVSIETWAGTRQEAALVPMLTIIEYQHQDVDLLGPNTLQILALQTLYFKAL